MIPLNLKAVTDFLIAKNYKAEFKSDLNQLIVVLEEGKLEIPMFVRIYPESELLQLLAFLPMEIKQSAMADTARLLHLINKELDTPGFGMDEDSKVTFFRELVPAKAKQIDPLFLESYLNAVRLACITFAPVIASVTSAKSTFNAVVKKAKELGHRSVSETTNAVKK